MPKIKIVPAKLSKLRKYALDGGSQDFEDIASLLGFDPESDDAVDVVKAYVAELPVAYPEDFNDDEEDEISEEGDVTDSDPVIISKVSLLDNGILTDMEIVSQKGNMLVVRTKKPTDMVKIVLKGEIVEIDLLDLPDNPDADFMEGVTVRQVRAAAEAARA